MLEVAVKQSLHVGHGTFYKSICIGCIENIFFRISDIIIIYFWWEHVNGFIICYAFFANELQSWMATLSKTPMVAGGSRPTLDLCLEIDSSWPIICGTEIHVGLGKHYPFQ